MKNTTPENPFNNYLLCTAILLLTILFSSSKLVAQQDSARSVGKVIPDTLLFRLEKVQAAILQINAANKKGYGSDKMRAELAAARTGVEQINKTLQVTNPLPESKDLVNYRIMLTDLQKNTSDRRTLLARYNADLQRMSDDIIKYSADSLLKVVDKDSTQRSFYVAQIKDLKTRLQQTGEITVAHLDTVSRLLADASAIYFTATDLQTTINGYLRDSDKNLLGQEADFLWKAPVTDKSRKMAKMIHASYAGQDRILRYFFNSTWDNRILLLILAISFFVWVHVNYRLIEKRKLASVMGPLEFKLISPIPILSTLVVFFNVTPLFEPHAPSIYIETNQFFLLVTLSALFLKRLEKPQLKWWVTLLFLYVLTVFLNVVVNESFLLRLCLIILSAASVYLGYRLYRRVDGAGTDEQYIKPVLIIHMALTALSIILNILGRLSLAKSFNITGISGVIQVISLAVLVQIVFEAMELHIKVSSCSGGVFSKINVNRSRKSAKKGLFFLCLWLWVLVFLINLNILDPIAGFVGDILVKERTFGSIDYTFGNILFFAIIIFLANQLQKNIGIFFGEEEMDFTGEKITRGSKLALIRLVIIVIGVLFAVSASGVPLTKITVLLGALGVGIGLGLQNIINNFVSGIILIFEKPFNIGDYIELADKKGKVLEIGIRSSKMLTSQGSRVIIPNGDLLSGRLVNYTEHDSHLKSELLFKVNVDADVATVKRLINEVIAKGEGVVKKAPKQILFNAVTGDSMEFKVLVWLTDVYAEPMFRSYFLEQVLQKFRANEIKMM